MAAAADGGERRGGEGGEVFLFLLSILFSLYGLLLECWCEYAAVAPSGSI